MIREWGPKVWQWTSPGSSEGACDRMEAWVRSNIFIEGRRSDTKQYIVKTYNPSSMIIYILAELSRVVMVLNFAEVVKANSSLYIWDYCDGYKHLCRTFGPLYFYLFWPRPPFGRRLPHCCLGSFMARPSALFFGIHYNIQTLIWSLLVRIKLSFTFCVVRYGMKRTSEASGGMWGNKKQINRTAAAVTERNSLSDQERPCCINRKTLKLLKIMYLTTEFTEIIEILYKIF